MSDRIELFKRDDPVAARTEWVGVAKGGNSFRTRRLVRVSPDRLEFRPTVMGRLIPFAFLLGGLAALAFVVHDLTNDREAGWLLLVPLVVGCAFAGLGGALYWSMTRRVAFDHHAGCFWKGGSTPRSAADAEYRKGAVPLAEIHAVQLIPKSLDSDSGSYHSYEINLVANDGSRTNVVDHGDLVCIRQDARQLAEFLGVSTWDAI